MKTLRKIFIVIAVLLSVAVIASILRHYQLRFAVARYVAQLKAEGEPMDLAHLLPAPTAPDQNGAPVFLKGAALLAPSWNALGTNPPSAMRMVAPGKAMIGWAQPDIRDAEVTNSWADSETAMAVNNEGLKLISQIVDYPTLDFNLNYQGGFSKMNNEHLAALKRSVQALAAEALDNLHNGNPAAAAQNISAMLALVNSSTNDRLVISELVRMAIAQMIVPVTWEALQATNMTEPQLATLQRQWADTEFIQPYENALKMENILGENDLARWRRSSSEIQDYLSQGAGGKSEPEDSIYSELGTKIKIFQWQCWWSYSDELRRLKVTDLFVETARSLQTNYAFLPAIQRQTNLMQHIIGMKNKVGASIKSDRVDPHFILSSSIGSLGLILDRVMRAEAAKQTVVAAIALKRYQIKNGNYPSELNSLAPEFIPAVPLDPADGQPLRYRGNADGTFLLYSIGENGLDNGGDPTVAKGADGKNLQWLNPRALDWVWPQPATEAEIQAYYQKPSSKSKRGN